jgi:hypothetical protein
MAWRCRLWLSALVAIGYGVRIAQAQPVDFACPKGGVIEERALGKLLYTGASPSDPYLCNRLNYKNEPEARLFNFYLMGDANNAAVRPALLELLSGRNTKVTFAYTSPTRYLSQETWTFVRREKVAVGGKTIDAIVLDREAEYQNRGAFHGHWVQWLDPKNGLWVKSQFNFISGQTSGQPPSYEDHSITIP